MERLKYCFYSNVMLVCNMLITLIGIGIMMTFFQILDIESRPIYAVFQNFRRYFFPAALLFVTVSVFGYEQPIRRCLKKIIYCEEASEALMIKAKRKLLNFPYVVIIIHLFVWITAALVFNIMYGRGMDGYVHGVVFRILAAGLIIVPLLFFLTETVLTRLMVAIFFPRGGLSGTNGVVRVSIGVHLAILIFVTCLVPLGTIYLNIQQSAHILELGFVEPLKMLQHLQAVVAGESALFMGLAIGLTCLVILNLTRPLKEIIVSLKAIHSGNYDRKVRVTSNDELGYTGDVINEMTDGLKERNRMRYALNLAKEVQQNLLPKNDPIIDGLDVAGNSVYCESVGGDYYDFFYKGNHNNDKIGIVVGDVSDHGLQSALIMATARSALHQRRLLPGGIAQIISDVNRQLVRDVAESGHFMTLFYAEIDRSNRCLRWANAGHDPAILYNPFQDSFDELGGGNIALGINENVKYKDFKREISPGQILIMGTDGIWESRNIKGEMFGKDKLKEIIKANAGEPAKEILTSVVKEVEQFIYPLKKEDDVTLVVIKILQLP
jgi:sigma-B regulation protein RsbU (phosphoserine phosphatase)